MTVSDVELDQTAFDSFLLALRVIVISFDLNEPAAKFEKPFELLRDIAQGHVTVSSPAELGVRFPALKELVYETASKVMEHDRQTAARILRGLTATL
jgi:hypothetical protein